MGSSNISEDLPFDNSIISEELLINILEKFTYDNSHIAEELLINNYPIFRGYNTTKND